MIPTTHFPERTVSTETASRTRRAGEAGLSAGPCVFAATGAIF
jgi:hypothetical protein